MSASLVGSEMCIRDRCAKMALEPRSLVTGTVEDVSLPSWARKQLSIATVSYTHLTLPTICSV
eukprot:11331354-Alexandrium_andersonii.AAC.1